MNWVLEDLRRLCGSRRIQTWITCKPALEALMNSPDDIKAIGRMYLTQNGPGLWFSEFRGVRLICTPAASASDPTTVAWTTVAKLWKLTGKGSQTHMLFEAKKITMHKDRHILNSIGIRVAPGRGRADAGACVRNGAVVMSDVWPRVSAWGER